MAQVQRRQENLTPNLSNPILCKSIKKTKVYIHNSNLSKTEQSQKLFIGAPTKKPKPVVKRYTRTGRKPLCVKPLSQNTYKVPFFQKKVVKKLNIQQKVVFLSNFLSGLPHIWCMYETISKYSNFDEIETRAYRGEFSTAKQLVKALTVLIAKERECIYTDTDFAIERLFSFRAIKRKLLLIQNYFHSYSDAPHEIPLKTPQEFLASFKCDKLYFSKKHQYFYIRIGDRARLDSTGINKLTVAIYSALHFPIFKLIQDVGTGYIWSFEKKLHITRLYISSNQSIISSSGKDNQSLILVDIRTGPIKSSLIVAKPFGSCHEVYQENTQCDFPVAWIWIAILEIRPSNNTFEVSAEMFSPRGFNQASALSRNTHKFLEEWFETIDYQNSTDSIYTI